MTREHRDEFLRVSGGDHLIMVQKMNQIWKTYPIPNWDRTYTTADCPYCHGTGRAPGSGATECGFCD